MEETSLSVATSVNYQQRRKPIYDPENERKGKKGINVAIFRKKEKMTKNPFPKYLVCRPNSE